jgi:hypothetical protein
MSDRRKWVVLTAMSAVGAVAGLAIGEVRSVAAQRIDPAYSAGTFQVSAGNQNEAWRVNTSTGETYHCVSAAAGVNCRRAEFK